MKSSSKNVQLKKYVKPEVKSQELTMRSLLGENGWLSSNIQASKVLAYTID